MSERKWKYPDEMTPPRSGHCNDRKPNFYAEDGRFFLVRCFSGVGRCNTEYGSENWMPASATGQCAWCGWEPPKEEGKPCHTRADLDEAGTLESRPERMYTQADLDAAVAETRKDAVAWARAYRFGETGTKSLLQVEDHILNGDKPPKVG